MFNIQPKQKTDEELGTDKLLDIDTYSDEGLGCLARYATAGYNTFWNGEVSPTILAKLLGTKLLEVFTKHAQTNAFIKSMDDSWVVQGIPDGCEVVWNQDGSGEIIDNRIKE